MPAAASTASAAVASPGRIEQGSRVVLPICVTVIPWRGVTSGVVYHWSFEGMSGNFVVAGGSQGIGLELVRRLTPSADRIDVYSRNVGELIVSDKVVHHACDFTDDDLQLEGLPDAIQGIAYCPGSINLRSFRSLKPADFRKDFEINLMGAVKLLQACLPGLKQGATDQPTSVVLFSTVAVGQGLPMHASIAAAKGAVEGLARSLAAEWAPKIRVNCVAPALTETPLTSRFFCID